MQDIGHWYILNKLKHFRFQPYLIMYFYLNSWLTYVFRWTVTSPVRTLLESLYTLLPMI